MTTLNLRHFDAPAGHTFGVSSEVMEKTNASLEISGDRELVVQHPAGTEFAVTLFTENGIVGACELVTELGQLNLEELVQGVTAAGEFTLKGE